MSFLNPGLLWLAAAGMVPIIIHLLNRQKYRRVRWAAMEFLLAALKRTQKKSKIQNLLILLIRILIMLLLALALARPFFANAAILVGENSTTLTLFVIDHSFSMGYKTARETALDRSKKRAEEILQDIHLNNADKAAIILMSDRPEILLHPTNKKELVTSSLSTISLSDFGTHFSSTAAVIAKVLDGSNNDIKNVYIFTDMQENGWIRDGKDAAKTNEMLKRLSAKAHFQIIDVGEKETDNYGIVSLSFDGKTAMTRKSTTFTAQVTNFSDTDVSGRTVDFYVNGEKRDSSDVYIPANETVAVSFTQSFLEKGPQKIKVVLEHDYLSRDDVRYMTIDVKESIKILCVDGQPSQEGSEVTSFMRALDPSGDAGTFALEKIPFTLFAAEELERYEVVVLANVQYLSSEKVGKLESYVQSGGSVFIALGDAVDREGYNETLYRQGKGLLPAELMDIEGDDAKSLFFHLVEMTYDHAILSYFRDHDLKAALSSLLYFMFFRVQVDIDDSSVRVFAHFDNQIQSPAFVERSFGNGRVLLYTSSLDMDWNIGPGRAPYVVLMNEIVHYLSSKSMWTKNLHVGDVMTIRLPMNKHAEYFQLTIPSREDEESVFVSLSPLLLKQEKHFLLAYPFVKDDEEDAEDRGLDEGRKAAAAVRSKGVSHAGHYALYRIDESFPEDELMSYFAVNVDSQEGDLTRTTVESIRRVYPGFQFRAVNANGESESVAKREPAKSDMWRYLLYLVLGLLVLETICASIFSKHRPLAKVTA